MQGKFKMCETCKGKGSVKSVSVVNFYITEKLCLNCNGAKIIKVKNE